MLEAPNLKVVYHFLFPRFFSSINKQISVVVLCDSRALEAPADVFASFKQDEWADDPTATTTSSGTVSCLRYLSRKKWIFCSNFTSLSFLNSLLILLFFCRFLLDTFWNLCADIYSLTQWKICVRQ